MVANVIYNIENYQVFDPDIGIHDTLANDFMEELRSLPLSNEVPRRNRMLDKISLEEYDTELLWWVIQYYNNILDPLSLDSVSKIQLPSRSDIETLLLKYSRQ